LLVLEPANVIAEIGPLAISRPPDGRSPGGFRPTAVARGKPPPGTNSTRLLDLSFIYDISGNYLKYSEDQKMDLSAVTEKFILHWGEMGTRWGVSRTVAQIHALLYLSERALHAEEIAIPFRWRAPMSAPV